MNKGSVLSLCLLGSLSAITYADTACKPYLVVLRHAEDIEKPKNAKENQMLLPEGQAHARAYGNFFQKDNFSKFLKNYDTMPPCPVTQVLAYATYKPLATAKIIADILHIPFSDKAGSTTVVPVDKHNQILWGGQGLTAIPPIPVLKPNGSTILVLDRQVLWSKQKGAKTPSHGLFLDKVVTGGDKGKIIAGGSPPFNFMYLLTNQNPQDPAHAFKNATVFVQKYSYAGNNNVCKLRLTSGNQAITIVGITPLPKNLYNAKSGPPTWDCTAN